MPGDQPRQIILSHLDAAESFLRPEVSGRRNTELAIPALCIKYHPQRPVLLADEEDASHLGRAGGEAR